jgi:clan AA aspartic protease (TIGR02281 family)
MSSYPQIRTRLYNVKAGVLAGILAALTLFIPIPGEADISVYNMDFGIRAVGCHVAFAGGGALNGRVTLWRTATGVEALSIYDDGHGDIVEADDGARLILVAGGEPFELFFRNARGALVFRLRGDEPFLPALVSGALVPFGPTRWGMPVTSVRLLVGATTYHALQDCAASATPLAAGGAPIQRPVAPYVPGTLPVPGQAGANERGSGVVEIALQRQHGGTFVLLATLNNTATAAFTLDTGASDVSIPRDLAYRLIADGTLTEREFVGMQSYATANGHLREPVYTLHSIRVGPLVIDNVECSIAHPGSIPLLGQSFLRRFRAVMLDQARSVLVLTP